MIPWEHKICTICTPSIPEIIWAKNVSAIVVCGFLMKSLKKHILKIWKKSWVPFGSFLLNSTANTAHFHSNWAELAVLLSRQILNGSQIFFLFIFWFSFIFLNMEYIETHARAFLTIDISSIDTVYYLKNCQWISLKKTADTG